ncbi:MAG: hypothetical protein C5B48_06895 [Candidatus Rokuibacteriota bacterium]|nr:MAG: hypothetical protein C5B48_06895 [Candidatus Rokubacteria bacterium]
MKVWPVSKVVKRARRWLLVSRSSRQQGRRLGIVCGQVPLAVSLAINLFSLAALAYASPPQRPRIPGVYSGANCHDVVLVPPDAVRGVQRTAAVAWIEPPRIAIRASGPDVAWTSAVPASLARLLRSPPLV